MMFLDSLLLPIEVMAEGGGPMKAIPFFTHS